MNLKQLKKLAEQFVMKLENPQAYEGRSHAYHGFISGWQACEAYMNEKIDIKTPPASNDFHDAFGNKLT